MVCEKYFSTHTLLTLQLFSLKDNQCIDRFTGIGITLNLVLLLELLVLTIQ